MAITTLQQVKDAMPGQTIHINKSGWGSVTNDMTYSGWMATGYPPTANTPGSGLAGSILTSASVGAVPLTDAVSGALYIAQLNLSVNRTAFISIYDRLWQNSAINVTSTSPQTINSVALTRPDANGVNAELWWQIYATMGAATPVVTISYTNSTGTAGRTATSPAFLNMSGNRTGPFNLDTGDIGVKSVETYTANASFVSGNIGLVIRRKVCDLYINGSGGYVSNDAIATTLPLIQPGACLEILLTMYSAGGACTVAGDLVIVNG
jgi:hypothetical protein